MFKKSYGRFLAAGLAAVMAVTPAFTVSEGVEAASAKKVKSVTLKIGKKTVTKKTYTLKEGAKATIKVTVSPAKAKKTITFTSSKKGIASVTKNGVVTAKTLGTAKITVAVKGKDKKVKKTYVNIKVTEGEEQNSQVTPEPEVTPTDSPSQVPGQTLASFTSDMNPIATTDSDGNPLYGGDPSVLVDDGTVYLYVGHDVSRAESYNIPEYCCYSTKDLKNWSYHGTVLNMKDVTWGTADAAWAGQVMKYNGKYYLYYCSWDKTDSGKQSIGVAVADNPAGPFKDKGTPLVKGSTTTNETSGWNDIDPTAWIETDSNGVEHRYLSWGNGKVFVCELNEDMVSVKDINGDGKITFGTQAGGKTSKDVDIIEKDVTGLSFTEAPWIYRRQDADGKYTGKYYLFYAYGWREQMAYATTDDLMDGKMEFGNILMPPSATSNTNHMAVFDFKGKTYFIYHNGSLPAGSGFRRAPCITEVNFNADGSITEIPETAAGINGTVSKIYTGNGDLVSHEKFENSGADSAYPYTKIGVGVYADAGVKDSEWVLTPGKADTSNSDYVSIQSENKPGLYLTANDDKSVTLAQDYDLNTIPETAKKQTFKKVAGLSDAKGVSYESVSQPGYYLTILGQKMYLMSGKDFASTFYLDNKPDATAPGGSLSNDNELTGITASVPDGDKTISITVEKDSAGNYSMKVPSSVSTVKAVLSIKDKNGYAFAGDVLAGSDGSVDIALQGMKTELVITVYAEDAVTNKTYKLSIEKDYAGFKFGGEILKVFDFEGQDDGALAVQKMTGAAKGLENKTGVTFKYSDAGMNGGKAITLDGTYGLKLLDDASVLGESYTISYWMKPLKLGGAVDPTLTAGTFSPEYWLNLTFERPIWSNNGGYVDVAGKVSYKENEWQNVVLVIDGSKAGTAANTVYGKLYINGSLAGEGDVAKDIMMKANSKVYFGANAWDAYFSGDLDEVMLIKGALSESDIQAISGGVVTAKNKGNL